MKFGLEWGKNPTKDDSRGGRDLRMADRVWKEESESWQVTLYSSIAHVLCR